MHQAIVRYETPEGHSAWGLLVEDQVHAIEEDLDGRVQLGPPVASLDTLSLLPPVLPTKIVCVGRNYPAHAAELGNEVPSEPLLFLKPPSALTAPHSPIVIPPDVGRVDFEGELALVMGKPASRIAPDEVPDAVLGVTCLNDVTARDLQKKDRTFTRAKGFDTFCPVGPVVVLDDIRKTRRLRTLVNGEVRQEADTADMIFDVCALVSYISHIMTLEPGDVIATGTPSGVGPLQPGDEVVVEIEGVGSLSNPVVSRT